MRNHRRPSSQIKNVTETNGELPTPGRGSIPNGMVFGRCVRRVRTNRSIKMMAVFMLGVVAAPVAVGQDSRAVKKRDQAASEARDYPTIGRIEDPGGRLPSHAKIEVIADGFTWCEGPVWCEKVYGGPCVLFSDIPRNTIFRWTESRGIETFMQPSGYTGVDYYGLEPGSNGLHLDDRGRLVLCEHGDRRISVLTPGGGKVTLADRFETRRLNSPNDLVVARDGSIYFTDPFYGLPDRANDVRREIDFCGVYRWHPDRKVELISDKIDRPNGIGLSNDQSRLIVAQSHPKKANWTLFDLRGGGNSPARVVADATDRVGQSPGLPDGLCVGSDDIVYASEPGGIRVMTFDGEVLARIITGKATSNCTLDDDETTLYITADDCLCRVRLR